ncbi:dual specificity protein phosphatase 19 [Euwallacea similis]|uniref:dual specificity protein phosphatase 19 n=1 Tax=Euwallacea similis TaxID=1736056 RepID=UPI00344B4E52
MSFLAELQARKTKLKPTETIVTQQDGQKFIETNSEFKKLDEVCEGFVVDTNPDDIPAQIFEHLYLGSQDCCELNILDKYLIRYVLSLGIDAPVKSPNVTYKFVKMLDLQSTNLHEFLPECLHFIRQCLNSQSNVLVHCNAGVSRSASIVIAFLILDQHLPFEQAFAVVKKARPCVRPNDGFMVQLRRLKKLG